MTAVDWCTVIIVKFTEHFSTPSPQMFQFFLEYLTHIISPFFSFKTLHIISATPLTFTSQNFSTSRKRSFYFIFFTLFRQHPLEYVTCRSDLFLCTTIKFVFSFGLFAQCGHQNPFISFWCFLQVSDLCWYYFYRQPNASQLHSSQFMTLYSRSYMFLFFYSVSIKILLSFHLPHPTKAVHFIVFLVNIIPSQYF